MIFASLLAGQLVAQVAPLPAPTTGPPPAAVATPSEPTQSAVSYPSTDCAATAEIRSIQMTARGLEIQATGPVSGRIVTYATFKEEGFTPYSTLTVEIPSTSLGTVPGVSQFRQGPFSSLRIVRYRSEIDCGLRLRLQPRFAGDWRLEPLGNGLRIVAGSAQSLTINMGGTQPTLETSPAGGIRVGGSVSASSGSSLTRVDLGFGQRLRRSGVVRGFLSGLTRSRDEPLFGAIGVSEIDAGSVLLDAAVGDLAVSLGETGLTQASFFSGVIFRGVSGGVIRENSRFAVFGGRAASDTLLRLPGLGQLSSPLSHDHLFGAQWTSRVNDNLGVGLAWTRSLPQGAPTQNNLYQSMEVRFRPTHSLRAMLEESFLPNGPTGIALTVDPRAEGKHLRLSGFFRYTSHDFRPALASSIFANLRRSYGLNASYEPNERIDLFASAYQAKTFSLFDPAEVGTFQSTRSVGASYRVTPQSSIFADYSNSSVRSDSGAILPIFSRTIRRSIGVARTRRRLSTTLRYSRERTDNRLNPTLDLRSDRFDLDSAWLLKDGGTLNGHAGVASSRRVRDGSAGSDYSASLSYLSPLSARGRFHAAIGVTQTPAGFALTSSRQEFVSVGYQPNRGALWFDGGIDVTYYLLQTGNGQRRHAWAVLLNASRLVDWGAGLRPDIPFANRALPILGTIPPYESTEPISARVFEDRNNNGVRDADEPWLSAVRIQIGERELRTSEEGEARARLARGDSLLRIAPQAALVDEYIAAPEQPINLSDRPASIIIAARPAGRIAGRVQAPPDVDRASIEGIRITVHGEGIDRDTVTDSEGEFRFGPLPAGPYVVKVDTTSLTPETRVEGSASIAVDIAKGARAEISFAIRKATARERFGSS